MSESLPARSHVSDEIERIMLAQEKRRRRLKRRMSEHGESSQNDPSLILLRAKFEGRELVPLALPADPYLDPEF